MLNKVKHDKRHQRRETYGGGARACCCSVQKADGHHGVQGVVLMEICCIYKGKHTVEVELGGLLLTGTREIHVATHSSSTPTITQGGGSGLLLCVREIKAEAAHAVQGVVCVLLHKGKHTAHGEVT